MPKVLLCGDVRGRLDVLAARVAKLQASSHGPFDAVLAAGDFWGPKDAEETGSWGECELRGRRARRAFR